MPLKAVIVVVTATMPMMMPRVVRMPRALLATIAPSAISSAASSAAVVVAGQNFSDDPNVLVFIIVAALIGLVLLMPIGGELGKRVQVVSEEAPDAA